MSKENTFPLSLNFGGQHYEGIIEPSAEKGPQGHSVYFRVSINGELFAYLCCGDNGWKERGKSSGQQDGLIQAIGNYIFEKYELPVDASSSSQPTPYRAK